MSTIEIKKANALKAYNGTDKKGKELLENLFGKEHLTGKITDRVKTFIDACEVVGVAAPYNRIGLAYAKDDESIEAYAKLCIIARALNEGWEPDWNDHNEPKYFPYFNDHKTGFGFSYSDYGIWASDSGVGSRLCFKSGELAEYAGKQFLEVYNQFLIIK